MDRRRCRYSLLNVGHNLFIKRGSLKALLVSEADDKNIQSLIRNVMAYIKSPDVKPRSYDNTGKRVDLRKVDFSASFNDIGWLLHGVVRNGNIKVIFFEENAVLIKYLRRLGATIVSTDDASLKSSRDCVYTMAELLDIGIAPMYSMGRTISLNRSEFQVDELVEFGDMTRTSMQHVMHQIMEDRPFIGTYPIFELLDKTVLPTEGLCFVKGTISDLDYDIINGGSKCKELSIAGCTVIHSDMISKNKDGIIWLIPSFIMCKEYFHKSLNRSYDQSGSWVSTASLLLSLISAFKLGSISNCKRWWSLKYYGDETVTSVGATDEDYKLVSNPFHFKGTNIVRSVMSLSDDLIDTSNIKVIPNVISLDMILSIIIPSAIMSRLKPITMCSVTWEGESEADSAIDSKINLYARMINAYKNELYSPLYITGTSQGLGDHGKLVLAVVNVAANSSYRCTLDDIFPVPGSDLVLILTDGARPVELSGSIILEKLKPWSGRLGPNVIQDQIFGIKSIFVEIRKFVTPISYGTLGIFSMSSVTNDRDLVFRCLRESQGPCMFTVPRTWFRDYNDLDISYHNGVSGQRMSIHRKKTTYTDHCYNPSEFLDFYVYSMLDLFALSRDTNAPGLRGFEFGSPLNSIWMVVTNFDLGTSFQDWFSAQSMSIKTLPAAIRDEISLQRLDYYQLRRDLVLEQCTDYKPSLTKDVDFIVDDNGSRKYSDLSGHLFDMLISSHIVVIDFHRHVNHIIRNVLANQSAKYVMKDYNWWIKQDVITELSWHEPHSLWHSYYDYKAAIIAYLSFPSICDFLPDVKVTNYLMREFDAIADKHLTFKTGKSASIMRAMRSKLRGL